jgi:hypothetical protein
MQLQVIPNGIEVAAGAKVLNYILKGVKIATFSQMFLQEFDANILYGRTGINNSFLLEKKTQYFAKTTAAYH